MSSLKASLLKDPKSQETTTKAKSTSPSSKKSGSKAKQKIATWASPLVCYEDAVQGPEGEADCLDIIYGECSNIGDGGARSMREDFCSTARIAKAWLHAHAYRQAYGVDIDLDMLKLSKHAGQSEENVKIKLIYGGRSPASTREVRNGNGTTEYRDPTESDSDTTTEEGGDEEALDLDGMFRPRLTLLHSNVLDAKASPPTIPKVDIICALNYAVGYFHERSVLVKYLRLCRERLNKGGVMVTDLFGGDKSVEKRDGDVDSGPDEGIYSTEKDALSEPILVRKGEAYGGFGYYIKETPVDIWGRAKLTLNFRFDEDGSWIHDAFSYDFRAYSIMEIVEIMKEVGFSRTVVFTSPRARETGEKTEEKTEDETEDGDTVPEDLQETALEHDARSLKSKKRSKKGPTKANGRGHPNGHGDENKSRTKDDDTGGQDTKLRNWRRIKPGERVFISGTFNAYVVGCVD